MSATTRTRTRTNRNLTSQSATQQADVKNNTNGNQHFDVVNNNDGDNHGQPSSQKEEQLLLLLETTCQEARHLWLNHDNDTAATAATTTTTLDPEGRRLVPVQVLQRVEELYMSVWEKTADSSSDSMKVNSINNNNKGNNESSNNGNNSSIDSRISSIRQHAGERLALLYLQSGRVAQADAILQSLHYKCRLGQAVLNYPLIALQSQQQQPEGVVVPCRIYDNFLTPTQARILQSVFCSFEDDNNFLARKNNDNYWTQHKYSVEPPSPYFSYVLPLKNTEHEQPETTTTTFLEHLLSGILLQIATTFKPSIRQANYCEMWSHARPHASGHQLHFDSDNEGQGGVIRNPVVSCILYLSTNTTVSTSQDQQQQQEVLPGGPSLITNQRLTSRFLADQGWLCHPKPNRLVVFNGNVLHGVIPGKGLSPSSRQPPAAAAAAKRVTLMFAFWKDIRIREETSIGAARPFPTEPAWAQTLLQPWKINDDDDNNKDEDGQNMTPADSIALDHVYETVPDGKPWTKSMGMPEYDQVFQGF